MREMTWQCVGERAGRGGRVAQPGMATATALAPFAAGRSFGIHHKYNVRPWGSGGSSG